MALADVLKTFKTNQDFTITGELDRYILGRKTSKDLGRPYEERAIGVHHPSALSSVACLRRHIYSFIDAPISNSQKSVISEDIFGAGHDFGYRMQARFWDMGILLGEWLCINCEHTWLDMNNPSPRICPNCGKKLEILYNLHYLEVPVYSKEHNILGKADALLLREWGKQLIELKTIKNRDKAAREETTCFEDLISPKSDHLYQVNLYMDMADKLYGGVKNGSVIYGSKNNNRRKEFSVRPVQQIIQEMYFRADMVTEYLTQEKLPERRSDQNVEDCRWCPWAKLCTTEHTFKDVDRRKVE